MIKSQECYDVHVTEFSLSKELRNLNYYMTHFSAIITQSCIKCEKAKMLLALKKLIVAIN